MRLAQAEAERLAHETMGTEHLLLGLLAAGEGYGAEVLAELGITLDKARVALEEVRPPGGRARAGRNPPFSRHLWRGERVALDEARARGVYRVGTEHLLMGVVEADGRGARVLERLGYEREAVRAAVQDLLERPGPKRAVLDLPPGGDLAEVGGAGGEWGTAEWSVPEGAREAGTEAGAEVGTEVGTEVDAEVGTAVGPQVEDNLEVGSDRAAGAAEIVDRPLGPAVLAAERAQRPEAGLLEPNDYLDVLEQEGEDLAAAAADGLEERVAACPGWTVADLVWHVGEVHTFWRQVVENRWRDPDDYVEPERPAWADLVSWFRAGLHDLVATLATTDPETRVWTWSSRRDAAWVIRRMAHETAVHRWDAEAATVTARSIDAALASDGVDEFLEFFLPNARPAAPRVGGSVHLEASDVRGEWLVRSQPHALSVTREHAPADAVVRAPASDLLLLLWRRRSYPGLDVKGSAAVLLRLLAHADLD